MNNIQDSATDQQLIEYYKAGYSTAGDLLISRHYSKVLRQLVFFTKNETVAEDLCQETFFKMLIALGKDQYREDEGTSFLSWVNGIARNVFLDYNRKQKRNREISSWRNSDGDEEGYNLLENLPDPDTVEKQIAQEERSRKVRAAILDLPEDYSHIAMLHLLMGKTIKECSVILNIPEGTAKGKVRRLRKGLAENAELAKEYFTS